jgi:hypothetical protein
MWFKVFVLSLFLFLVVVTMKLYRRLPGPFRRAWWLLGLLSLGFWLLNVGWDYVSYGRVEPLTLFADTCGVLVVWAGMNVTLFYRARRYFTEPEKE